MGNRVADEVKKIGDRIASEGVTADELERALEPIITGIKEMRQKNTYWLNTVLAGSVAHPEQIGWSRSILPDYAAITTADMTKLAKKYLISGKSAQIVIHPRKDDGKRE